jgi:hypothetical protein
MIRIAILDDYQNVALEMADWSPLAGRALITACNDHLSNFDEIVERLLPFEVVCVMRERTPLPRSVIERLPRLKLIASTGPRNAAIDVAHRHPDDPPRPQPQNEGPGRSGRVARDETIGQAHQYLAWTDR